CSSKSLRVELDIVDNLILDRPPVTTSWLLPAVTAPGTASLHLLLAHQARPLYSLAPVHPFFLASSIEAAVFLFLTERMRLSLSPHPQNSVIALLAAPAAFTVATSPSGCARP